MYTITENAKYNSLEVSFDEKPGKAVLSALKALKFRWNNAKKIWYGFCDRAELEKALSGEQMTEQTAEPTAEPNKELIKHYIDEVVTEIWENKESWRDYYKKKIDDVIEIQGKLIALEKPGIKTDFYFGEHGFDYDEKTREAARAEKSEDFFINENLSQLDGEKWLKKENYNHYIGIKYQRAPENTRIYQVYDVPFCYVYEGRFKTDGKIELTENDVQTLLKAYENQKIRFKKRLKTYLKRYGLSKVSCSTYWADR